MPAQASCTTEEKVPVSVSYVTAAGNPAQVQGATAFVPSGDATFERTGDHEGYLVSGGPGDTIFVVEADADLGDGVVLVSDIITLSVSGAMASAMGITLGAPVPK